MDLKKSATCYKQKTEIVLFTRKANWLKFDYCSWFLRQDKKGIKANLQLILYELKLQLLSCKISFKLRVKPLLNSAFLLNT